MVGFFKIHHFHRSIAEKGVFMVHLTSPYRPKLQNHKTLDPPTTASLSPHRDDDLRNYEATYDLANDVHASTMTLESSAYSAVYFALSYCLYGTGIIRGPRLMEYFWACFTWHR